MTTEHTLQQRTIQVRMTHAVARDPAAGVTEEDQLLQRAIEENVPHIRFWFNAPCIVIGRGYARRLPRFAEQADGVPVLVRSSGGEVVLHGPGVLNISVAIPTTVWHGPIHAAFAGLSEPVATALNNLRFQATIGEIQNAYCPGDHDVAVNGQKVLGMSQRRVREGILVHGSLNVAIDREQYTKRLQQFYKAVGLSTKADIEKIGTLHAQPTNHPSECVVAQHIQKSLLALWTERTKTSWIVP